MLGKTLVILQSNYIPWKGYFDLIAAAGEFMIFDEVQYTRRDWRNRNKLIVGGKPHWLTIPVESKGRYDASIDSMVIADKSWAKSHWATIKLNYSKAPHFRWLAPVLEEAYAKALELERLTDVNELFLRTLCGLLDLKTPMIRTTVIPRSSDDPVERLIEICKARGATSYISGPAAKAYIDPKGFADAGIALYYANYSGYPAYDQPSEVFEHGVSVIDVLMNCGPAARGHLKSLQGLQTFVDSA